jgi:hypothetical protein
MRRDDSYDRRSALWGSLCGAGLATGLARLLDAEVLAALAIVGAGALGRWLLDWAWL